MTTNENLTPVPRAPRAARAPAVTAPDALQLFERLARDPNISIEKLERLVALHDRATARIAEQAFNASLAAAQRDIRPVAADADNPQTRSHYASYVQLDRALRPIYTNFGFALSFNTADGAPPDWVRMTCEVTHVDGGAKLYHLDVPADGKGARGGDVMTKTHAVASAVTYGSRYLLKMIFNVAIGEDDDDGNRASARRQPRAHDQRATAELVDHASGEVLERIVRNPTDNTDTTISEAQMRRLFVIAKKAGWDTDALRTWLKEKTGHEHTRDILRRQYDDVCAALEAGPVGDGAGAPL